MDTYTATALAYNNGYEQGYEQGKKDAVKHGRWVGLEYDGYADGCPVYDLWECSECGEEVRGEDVPDTHLYCSNCGCRMDGGNVDG